MNYLPGGIEELFLDVSVIDYCVAVLKCQFHEEVWQACQLVAKECGWILPFEEVCFVCDRPRVLKFDSDDRLHAEGELAIQFADGYRLYSYHGVTLPEKYGSFHPNNWQANWLLEETNSELRRVLIQGIGYTRICQELQAVELDNWQEYTRAISF